MYNMYYRKLYNEAYSKIGPATPIHADCGALCGARCCKGDREMGMIIFPGEEQLLLAQGFALTRREMAGYPVWFATCRGRCRRVARPLSCRIFPLAPLYEQQRLTIVEDPRARAFCPLLSAQAVDTSFACAIKAAFEVLVQDAQVREMLMHYTKMLREYQAFWRE